MKTQLIVSCLLAVSGTSAANPQETLLHEGSDAIFSAETFVETNRQIGRFCEGVLSGTPNPFAGWERANRDNLNVVLELKQAYQGRAEQLAGDAALEALAARGQAVIDGAERTVDELRQRPKDQVVLGCKQWRNAFDEGSPWLTEQIEAKIDFLLREKTSLLKALAQTVY